jgi:hypothetical protein
MDSERTAVRRAGFADDIMAASSANPAIKNDSGAIL